jgi:hypothetical protein
VLVGSKAVRGYSTREIIQSGVAIMTDRIHFSEEEKTGFCLMRT